MAASTPQVEMVVRTLRHEIGDLLQSVYSAVAILQQRLPNGQQLERTILSDLRGRAETCKNELDATHDLVCPIELNRDGIDLGELSAGIASTFSLRFPNLQIVCSVPRPFRVWADAPRLAQAGNLLMVSLCPAAKSRIEIRAQPANGKDEVAWIFDHDGPPPTAEQLSWLRAPFSTTRQARFGLGLALAGRILELHGGRLTMSENGKERYQIALVLPPEPPPG